MAGFAGFGCRFVKQNEVSVYELFERVTRGTGDILMAALERESCLLVIKKGWLPFVAVMAGSAIAALRLELVGMRILMAFAALCRGTGELNMQHRQLHVWRLVAIDARHRAVRSQERKLCVLMVEF